MNGNWKQHTATRRLAAADIGEHLKLHEELEMREFSCPSCATLLELEVARKDSASLHDVELKVSEEIFEPTET